MSNNYYAILVDGGFFTKEYKKKKGHYPKADDIEEYCKQFQGMFDGNKLYRIFYYNSIPTREISETNPLNPAGGPVYAFSQATVDQVQRDWNNLDRKPFFAMRQGTLKKAGWTLARDVIRNISEKKRDAALLPTDLEIKINQKQVDLKIGMDVAHLAFKSLVAKIVLITDDADLAPAAKLARVEGLQVYLDPMNRNVPRELERHTDVVLRTKIK